MKKKSNEFKHDCIKKSSNKFKHDYIIKVSIKLYDGMNLVSSEKLSSKVLLKSALAVLLRSIRTALKRYVRK